MPLITQRLLFLLRRPPAQGVLAREAFDMVQMAGAFDQPVSLLFLDDGVWQLFTPDNVSAITDGFGPLLDSLAMLGVDDYWVEEESLSCRGLSHAPPRLPAKTLARADFAAFLARYDRVLCD